MSFSSDKHIVLITGANGGIGFDTAKALAMHSPTYHVILCSRSLPKGEKALSSIQALKPPGTLSLLELDVNSPTSISAAAKQVSEQFGHLDTLINNAGIYSPLTLPLSDQLTANLRTNTLGSLLVTEAFLPLLKKTPHTHTRRLITISSRLGSLSLKSDPSTPHNTEPHMAYRISKAAVNMMTICYAQDLAKDGIKVFAVCPGYVVTNLSGEEDRENRVKRGAGSSEVSAETILGVVEGGRDGEAGGFLHKDGVYPW
ncbi:MAG: hypothetical protein M1834_007173 [Cirrosporium novae-zelandiae]|nr:MAG: hypothetical protein M1834_007173 [Cirrosporium novae-zelandiae]